MLPLRLIGARTHNLKGIDLSIEPGSIVAITGVSGSGKSSLALDTLYAEGQRRFVESFSPYARQFLERLERPPMQSLEPVPAAIAVDRAAPVKSSRSTVATMADIEPLVAALFLREGLPRCPTHGVLGVQRDVEATARELLAAHPGERAVLSYRIEVPSKTRYLELREELASEGYQRLWFDGETRTLDELRPSEVVRQGHLDVVVDRVRLSGDESSRLRQGIEQGFRRGGGALGLVLPDATLEGTAKTAGTKNERRTLRLGWSCPICAESLAEPKAGFFSYESPIGACGTCRGFGRIIGVDLDKVIPDPYKTLAQRAIRPWNGKSSSRERGQLKKLCERVGIPMDVPWLSLPEAQQRIVLHGDEGKGRQHFSGVLGWFRWLETKSYKMHVRVLLSRYRSYETCPTCHGSRLNERALGYSVADWDLAGWHRASVSDVLERLRGLACRTEQGRLIASQLEGRVGYLERVGLGYLSLDRQARTLSGGEAQRVTLTAALGSSLHNALFVLDEPSVGLHPTDIPPLAEAIRELAARNNSVLLIEHDPELIRHAERVIELGPGAGTEGGQIVFDGSLSAALRAGGATARACAPRKPQPSVKLEPAKNADRLLLSGVSAHNLKQIDVEFPLGRICAVSGPSGSGKSSLVVQVLYRALARQLGDYTVERPAPFTGLSGGESLRRVVLVDQSPLGRTSRGNAATYTKAWDAIRKLFAEQPAAKQRRLPPSHFSFNVDGGRCEACAGEGYETVEMQFLADVRLSCPVCQGQRFKPEILRVTLGGLNVAELLDCPIDEVLGRFRAVPGVLRALGPLSRLGLGYVRLGQPLSTLSGGEAQRVKLARALTEKLDRTLFVVDEPSAGLHADEVARVVECFRNIVTAGGSVICVEHDLDVLRSADWIIDIGPGSGEHGGRVVAAGPPDMVARTQTRTGEALRAFDRRERGSGRAKPKRTVRRARPQLEVRRAREHNLKDVSVDVPHGALTVVTGPSGSGKSSLVFDVLFAEGQRRFLETLTPYARRFLPTLPKPDVDSVSGVPPSIALEQRSSRAGANSTVSTVTEVAHYLRLLFAKLGVPHCPTHQLPIGATHPELLLERLRRLRGSFELLAPVVEARKGTYLDVFNAADRDGIEHAYCDGKRVGTGVPPRLAKSREHSIDLVMREAQRLATLERSELDRALAWGGGSLKLRDAKGEESRFSTSSSCPTCGFSVPELDPRWFSFNTKQGQCPSCEGRGSDESGVPCRLCGGTRLGAIPRGVLLSGASYPEMNAESVAGFSRRIAKLRFSGDAARIADPILSELLRRVNFLVEVGLGYLTLGRAAQTLSGGEMQRLRLAAQLGAGLTGALYVLDEPTIGLHPRDTQRLIDNLRQLVRLGSTVVVVEHDAEMIRAADHLIDMGPGGGSRGGQVIAQGPPEGVLSDPASPTGRSLASTPHLRAPLVISREHLRLELEGVRHHNVRLDLSLPVGRFNVVAGVSGSGKSSLVRGVLLPAVRERLGLVTDPPGSFTSLGELHGVARALCVDQSPIGRTPRSVPATFLGLWDLIRKLFAETPEARLRGYAPGRFSFNTATGGRCPSCDGQGVITHEMSFLPDVVQNCSVCDGSRFEPETLQVKYLDLDVGEVLRLTVEEACGVFAHHPKLVAPLETLRDLGAGYLQLGQGSHTLSGGESQRLKLSAELTAGTRHEPTLYVLDEPTTGLHHGDVEKLVRVLDRLVQRGDTLVVIEHHPWVIACADHVIELGPEGGEAGGRVIARGSPTELAEKRTPTGEVLRTLR